MKLWQKIFLPTLALMVCITALGSVLLLRFSRDALWQREEQRGMTQLEALAGELRSSVLNQRIRQEVVLLGEGQTRQIAVEKMEEQALGQYLAGLTLTEREGEVIYDRLPQGLTLPQGEWENTQCQLQQVEGQWYLVCAMPLALEGGEYRLGGAYEVTDLQSQLEGQGWQATALSLALSLVGALTLLVLVRRLLRPLAALSARARHIARGNYAERLEPRSQDELAQLARDMNTLAQGVQERVEQLERVAEERRVFVANLAHEMKTPLTSIMGYADLLYLPRQVEEGQRVEYSGIILEEARRLRSLSAKLLELLTVGSANLVFVPTDLRGVVEEVAVSLEPVLAQSHLTLTWDCPSMVLSMDVELFKSLLYNLLDNGRKASPAGETLTFIAREEGGQGILTIRDRGRGIPREELDKICQPFYMVDKSRSRKAGGAGLGLALCQSIVAAHGGRMEFDSKLGEGTQVTLTFPLWKEGKEDG